MAIRITIEKVDPGAKDNGSFTQFTYAQAPIQPDILPVELILDELNTTGATIDALKKVLTLCVKGKLSTLSTGVPADSSLNSKINSVYLDLNP